MEAEHHTVTVPCMHAIHRLQRWSNKSGIREELQHSYQFMLILISRDFFFFFQAEDGIRDLTVTGVQTCALPISDTLDEMTPDGKPNPPSEMINSVIEAVYDDYLKAKFPNYEARRDDLNVLAN